MRITAVENQLLLAFDDLPRQLQTAARWLLDNRDDVAFLSMREIARQAGVKPATMTRLAQRLGFEGFAALHTLFAEELRSRSGSFRERAEGLRARRALDGDSALISDTLALAAGHVRALSAPETLDAITSAADIILESERVYWIGARSGFAPIYLGSYLFSLIGEESRLLDQAGGIGLDALSDLSPTDALVALSISPYTSRTVDAVAYAVEEGARVIAITDSRTAPIARNATVTVLVPTEAPSFLQTMMPAFLVIECLAALVAARRGRIAINSISRAEVLLDRFGSYAKEKQPQRRRKA